MIHAVQVKDGQVSYHNHQLETKRFKEKTRLGGFDPYFNLGDTL